MKPWSRKFNLTVIVPLGTILVAAGLLYRVLHPMATSALNPCVNNLRQLGLTYCLTDRFIR